QKSKNTNQFIPAVVRARYDAAQTTADNVRHWAMADGLSADSSNSADVRKKLRQRARYEVANNSYAKGIVLTLANDAVGTGPRLQLLSNHQKTNHKVERAFSQWSHAIPTTGDALAALTGWGPYSLLASVSGIPAMNQFRRATTWPEDWTDWNDPAYSLGKIQLYSPFTTSDIMGPWIFADIQSALNKLIWTWGREGWTANGTNNYWTGVSDWGYGTQEDPDWLEAKAQAESRYSIYGSAENEPWTFSLGHNYSVPRHYGLQ
ncbi:unnamed protein product, partial [marine sediment metagenome]